MTLLGPFYWGAGNIFVGYVGMICGLSFREWDATGEYRLTKRARPSPWLVVGIIVVIICCVGLFMLVYVWQKKIADKYIRDPRNQVKDDYQFQYGIPNFDQRSRERSSEDYTDALNNRGSIYQSMKEYDKAIADYTEVIRLDPRNVYALYNRGRSYQNKEDYDRAIADYTVVIRLNPQDAFAFYHRGYVYQSKKRYDRAIADYSVVIWLDPQDADAFSNRGHAYQSMKEYDRAIADFTDALRLDPRRYADLRTRIDELKASSGRRK
jgi:tetratricopeptide (TPR) repeat protein